MIPCFSYAALILDKHTGILSERRVILLPNRPADQVLKYSQVYVRHPEKSSSPRFPSDRTQSFRSDPDRLAHFRLAAASGYKRTVNQVVPYPQTPL